MTALSSFLSMGGYGGFVWSAYGAMVIIFCLSIYLPLKHYQAIKTKLRSKY